MDIGGLVQMLMSGKMGGGGSMGASSPWTAAQPQTMGGGGLGGPPAQTRADAWNAAYPQKPSIWSQIGQGMLDAQKGGWGYGAMNSLSQPQGGAQPVGTGAQDKELSSLLMLLNILQSGGMTQGLGKM